MADETRTAGPFQVLGSRFTVKSALVDVVDEVAILLDRFRVAGSGDVVYHLRSDRDVKASSQFRIDRGGTAVWHAGDRWNLVEGLLHAVHDFGLSRLDAGTVPIHASAVMAGDIGILMPGRSGAGKTSLAAALSRSGFAYVTDETAVIDVETVRLQPYARPFRFKPGGFRAAFPNVEPPSRILPVPTDRFFHVLPEELGENVSIAKAGCDVGLVVLLTRTGDPGVQRISRAGALAELSRLCFGFRHHGAAWLPALARLIKATETFRLTSRSVEHGVSEIERLVGATLPTDVGGPL